MGYQVEFSPTALNDLSIIYDHLADSYLSFGETVETATVRAEARVGEIRAAAGRIATAPDRGEAHADFTPHMRHLTLGQAVYWFDIDTANHRIVIAAVFYGSQDHKRQMARRMLGGT